MRKYKWNKAKFAVNILKLELIAAIALIYDVMFISYLIKQEDKMFTNKDKLYLQTKDIPNLKNTIDKAIELSNELKLVLNELDNYNIEFKISSAKKEET